MRSKLLYLELFSTVKSDAYLESMYNLMSCITFYNSLHWYYLNLLDN